MVRSGRDRLAGTVEIDETYMGGKRSGKRGRGARGKTLVVVAVVGDNRNGDKNSTDGSLQIGLRMHLHLEGNGCKE